MTKPNTQIELLSQLTSAMQDRDVAHITDVLVPLVRDWVISERERKVLEDLLTTAAEQIETVLGLEEDLAFAEGNV